MAMELTEYLDRETGISEENREQFIVDDEQKANWALRKMRQLTEKKEASIQLAETEIERIKTWLEEVNGELQSSIDFFTSLLAAYHRQVLEQDPKAKTIKLPYGQLKMRAQQPEFRRDNDKLLAWMKREWVSEMQEDFIKTIESPNWAELKKYLEIAGDKMVDPGTGLVVDGVEVIEREAKFSVEVYV